MFVLKNSNKILYSSGFVMFVVGWNKNFLVFVLKYNGRTYNFFSSNILNVLGEFETETETFQ